MVALYSAALDDIVKLVVQHENALFILSLLLIIYMYIQLQKS